MEPIRSRTPRILAVGAAVLAVGSAITYAAIVVVRYDGASEHIGLRGGAAQVMARVLRTPAGEVTQGTITIEDGCGATNQYSAGEAFETSEGRVHRAYNLGAVDAVEYNMFVGPPARPLGVNIPDNEHRCGPPSTVDECRNGGWGTFTHPAPFGDQGACIAYVNQRRRITLLVPEDPIR